MAKLVLIRHGESEWNAKGLWTGWTDIDLSEKGRDEAQQVAKLLNDIPFDICFTSNLKRAHHTLEIILQTLNRSDTPITASEKLNERNYGDYTGKNKWEVKEQIGDEAFLKLRRSWDYPVPNGESLKQVSERVYPYFTQEILPLLQSGKNVLLVAHGNSIRGLIKQLENVPNSDIASVEIKTGEAIIYDIDSNGGIVKKENTDNSKNAS